MNPKYDWSSTKIMMKAHLQYQLLQGMVVLAVSAITARKMMATWMGQLGKVSKKYIADQK